MSELEKCRHCGDKYPNGPIWTLCKECDYKDQIERRPYSTTFEEELDNLFIRMIETFSAKIEALENHVIDRIDKLSASNEQLEKRITKLENSVPELDEMDMPPPFDYKSKLV